MIPAPLESQPALLAQDTRQATSFTAPALVKLHPCNHPESELDDLADDDKEQKNNDDRLDEEDDVADPPSRNEADVYAGRDYDEKDGRDDATDAQDELQGSLSCTFAPR